MNTAMQAAHDDRFTSIARQMGKWMDQVLGPAFQKYDPGESWSPAVNFCEDDEFYCIVVELAGVSPEQLDMQVEGRKLTISGFRQVPGASEFHRNVKVRHMEIDHGPFSRALTLPDAVDTDRIDARYRGGYLWIHIPKKQ